ncbi:MAG: hypothetical protein HQK57_13985 [Deltaproteobacteria bacterium]|nr:hypothetical protein [Deltaproteobacteria bacterium]
MRVKLWLQVENNSKFVRGKTKAREDIERFVLREYNMKKPEKDGWEYELTIPYENDADLDKTIYDILAEMESTADIRHCFIEANVTAIDSDRSW